MMENLKRKKRISNIILIFVVFLGVGLGFSLMNQTIHISGNSEVKKNTWDVHLDNILVIHGSVEPVIAPVIEDSGASINFSVKLDLPGDFYEFTVDLVNAGSMNASIDRILKTPELTTAQKKYLNYIIEYQNGEDIVYNQLISGESKVKLKIRIEYRDDITSAELPKTTQNLNLGLKIDYIQADKSATPVKNNGLYVPVTNGSLDEIGTVVMIGKEAFYTIGTEGDNVKLLALHNLYVGGKEDKYLSSDVIPYGDEATGMQDVRMNGYYSGMSPGQLSSGVTVFSSSSQKGTNYSDYTGSIIEGYVNNYKNKLEEIYEINVIEAGVLSRNEVETGIFNCASDLNLCKYKYPWLFAPSYWTNTPSTTSPATKISMWLSTKFIEHNYDFDGLAGVRPVIVLPKSSIIYEDKPLANGDINDVGTFVSIGTENFYTIGTDGDNVKLFAEKNIALTDNPVQDNNAATIVTAFSSASQKGTNYSDYNGSIVEGYVNKYKTNLVSKYAINIVEARLITLEELLSREVGCYEYSSSYTPFYCNRSPRFVVKSEANASSHYGYWTGSAKSNTEIFTVDSMGGEKTSYSSTYHSVRPVIVVPKSLF